MITPSIRLIPDEYLERVKGKVSTRQELAREANLPKVVLDRLVCDRSKSVREEAAKNPGLDAEQVKKLLAYHEYYVTYNLNCNHALSHEMVELQVRDRYGVRLENVFQNPNIKATEFVNVVKLRFLVDDSSSWSKRNVYRSAVLNPGVGNGAIIALTEHAYKEDTTMYADVLEFALRNSSLSSRSIEYLIERAKRRLPDNDVLVIVKAAVYHPNVRDSFVDSVVTERLAMGNNVIREFNFNESYKASKTVLEQLDAAYLNRSAEDYLSFLANNVPLELLTPARLAALKLSQEPTTLTAMILNVPSFSEEEIDEFVMRVAMHGSIDQIKSLAERSYLTAHHIDQMARSTAWKIRVHAAQMHGVSAETLKRLALDADSDVRREARLNPNWSEVEAAVKEQEAAHRFSERVIMLCIRAEETKTDLLAKYEEEFPSIRPILEAIKTLADPKTKDLMQTFKTEESRRLMRDGVDSDTLALLKDFF